MDPQETIRITQFASPIFQQVYDYASPVDLKGNAIIDIRPQANRTLLDRYLQIYNQDFDLNKAYTLQPSTTVQFNQGIKTLRIDNNLLFSGILLNMADGINDNGTWVASGGATNLTQDNLFFVNGASSSLSFELLSGHSTGTLTNSTMQPQNLAEGYLQAQQFLYSFLPIASNFSQIELRFGSSASNYYSEVFTMTQSGTVFQNGWNLFDGQWATATQVGTPNNSAINYIQVIWTYNGTQMNGIRLNQIWSRLGIISEIEYYSKYLFQNAQTGAFQETITDPSNIINLDTESRNLLFFLTGKYCVQQIQGLDALFFDSNDFAGNYQTALTQYKARYKSQIQKPKSTYYYLPNPSNQNYVGRRFSY